MAAIMALVAKKADDRERDADERAQRAEEADSREQESAQAQLMNYRFIPDSSGATDSLVIENRSQKPVTKLDMAFGGINYYLHFDLIPPCSWMQVRPLQVTASDGITYDLRLARSISIQFLDDRGLAWKKTFTDGSSLNKLEGLEILKEGDASATFANGITNGNSQDCS
ncbi:hypothetical protein ACOT81_28345 [Streptomyces sp. WI04-05B]|uniref:hypothetical protein n=1 Tax=Streptomyces TaxID=1883 RepID=UPI0029A7CF9B|nr:MULTISPECIES: hypothetical protein [unclassified Streptomyces]MDX2544414.1 hypothetical protein [Streptomyces sp. WI04-05B]MDX2588517.1 hypothetical protein [Streptomyces sp. WI04-05A]MDX3750556.1 hypothetical protein [Streptomyces sp. AK08-02]